MKSCPCGTGLPYEQCCGEFLSGKKIPVTPEQLMRSRYTAYTKANMDYIIATMKSPAADNFDKQSARRWAKNVIWLGLHVTQSYVENDNGFVEFIATYTEESIKQQLHELSTFRLIDGHWYYVDGKIYT